MTTGEDARGDIGSGTGRGALQGAGLARRFLRLTGRGERADAAAGHHARTWDEEPFSGLRAASLCVASGKGGTGKSVVSASVSTLFSRSGKTLIIDADMGVGNAHILQDVCPEHSLVDVVDGKKGVKEVIAPCSAQLDLLAAGSGFSQMASLSSYELHVVASGIESLEKEYEYVVVDSAAGISHQTIAFAAACDVVLIVTTPDVTAMTDAYAFLKVLLQRKPDVEPLLVVNRATSFAEAEHVAERMCSVSHKFLAREPRWIGTIPEDSAVLRSVNRRVPTVTSEPQSSAAQALRGIAVTVLEELAKVSHAGVGRILARNGAAASV